MHTNWTPSIDGIKYQTNDCTIAIYYNASFGISNGWDGARNAVNSNQAIVNPFVLSNQVGIRLNQNTNPEISSPLINGLPGLYFFTRASNTSINFKLADNAPVVGSSSSTNRPNRPFLLLAANTGGSSGLFHDRKIAFAMFGSSMTELRDSINTAIENYKS